jgi:hypothetical protein
MIESADMVCTQHLDPGERLLWSGQPRQGIRFQSQDLLLIPFTVMWCGFAVFWEYMALNKGGPIFFGLWGLPFVAAGLYIVFGRFWVAARQRANSYYGVTNERVLIVSGLFSREIKSLQLRTLSDISLTEKRDGSGTVTFGPVQPWANMFTGTGWPGAGRNAPPAFEQIANAKEVYNIIRQAQRAT